MREYEFSIGAGAQNQRTVTGSFVRVKSADAEINIKVESAEGRVLADLNLSEGMRFAVPEMFKTIRIQNDTAGVVGAVLVIGVGDVDDARLSGQLDIAKPGTLTTSADVSLLATAKTLIKSASLTRTEIIITNLSVNTQIFRIGDVDTGAARGSELQPGQSITLETTAAVYGYNPGAGAESVAVVEVLD